MPDDPPGDSPPGGGPEAAAERASLRLVVRREHSLLALMELSRSLWRSQDVYAAADALLLNLMGQIGTARAALWLRSPGANGLPVLIRSHGIAAPDAAAMLMSCWTPLLQRFETDPRPLRADQAPAGLERAARAVVRRANVALFAPMRAESEVVGLVALGAPAGGRGFEALDVQMLEASLDIAGVALRNAYLQGRILENQRQLRAANDSLRELDRLKSQFIDNVNHELRTPLTIVIGCLSCLNDGSLSVEAGRGLVDSASRSAQQLLHLIESLLTFSSASRGGLTLELIEADLSEFLTGYYEQRRPGVSAGLRELHWRNEGHGLRARFDPHRLRSILDELVDNAVRFTPQGSNIRLELSEHVEGDGRWMRIGVRDDGYGLPSDQLPALFQTFRQVDGSMTREVGGMGMGLPTAQKVAEAMGGRITVASEPGRGCLFSVLLRGA